MDRSTSRGIVRPFLALCLVVCSKVVPFNVNFTRTNHHCILTQSTPLYYLYAPFCPNPLHCTTSMPLIVPIHSTVLPLCPLLSQSTPLYLFFFSCCSNRLHVPQEPSIHVLKSYPRITYVISFILFRVHYCKTPLRPRVVSSLISHRHEGHPSISSFPVHFLPPFISMSLAPCLYANICCNQRGLVLETTGCLLWWFW